MSRHLQPVICMGGCLWPSEKAFGGDEALAGGRRAAMLGMVKAEHGSRAPAMSVQPPLLGGSAGERVCSRCPGKAWTEERASARPITWAPDSQKAPTWSSGVTGI